MESRGMEPGLVMPPGHEKPPSAESLVDPAGHPLHRDALPGEERCIELREERLVARKELREVGQVEIRKEVEELPGRLEVEAYREEVEVEHVPVGETVRERQEPWEEAGVLVVPVYEEVLVVSKRLVLKEKLRIRRVATSSKQLFTETLLRERLVIADPAGTGVVHELYSTGDQPGHGAAESASPEYRRSPRAEREAA